MTTLWRPKENRLCILFMTRSVLVFDNVILFGREKETKNVLHHRNLEVPRHAGRCHGECHADRRRTHWGVSGSVQDMGLKGAALQARHEAGVPFRVSSGFKHQFSAACEGDLDTWRQSDHVSVLFRWHLLAHSGPIGLCGLSHQALLEVTVAPCRFQPLAR